MSRTDEELVASCLGGDRSAFDLLVLRWDRKIQGAIYRLIGSEDDARDVCQEAFLKVYKARDTFRDGDPFLPWFHRILRNTCFSFLRGKGRLRPRSLSDHGPGGDLDDADYEIEDAGAQPGDRLLADERASAFHKAFATLSARDREILALRHFEEQSYRAISIGLGIPEGTVMSRLFHARRRLREVLGERFLGEAGLGSRSEGGEG